MLLGQRIWTFLGNWLVYFMADRKESFGNSVSEMTFFIFTTMKTSNLTRLGSRYNEIWFKT
jgi:hypothetical protein